jgi:hypothetical protein
MHTKLESEILKGADHLEDLGVYRKIILKLTLRKWCEDVNWICLTQDRAWWQAVVNAVMDIYVPLKTASFLTSEQLLGSLLLKDSVN